MTPRKPWSGNFSVNRMDSDNDNFSDGCGRFNSSRNTGIPSAGRCGFGEDRTTASVLHWNVRMLIFPSAARPAFTATPTRTSPTMSTVMPWSMSANHSPALPGLQVPGWMTTVTLIMQRPGSWQALTSYPCPAFARLGRNRLQGTDIYRTLRLLRRFFHRQP